MEYVDVYVLQHESTFYGIMYKEKTEAEMKAEELHNLTGVDWEVKILKIKE